MKRRRNVIEKEKILWRNNKVSIINIEGQIIFEIRDYTTVDLVEAVVLMANISVKDDVWSLSTNNFDKNIDPEKSLYWLSGGDSEWMTLEHYSESWYNLHQDFSIKWSPIINSIVSESKNLAEIKEELEKRLNLAIIYDWAISRGFTRL